MPVDHKLIRNSENFKGLDKRSSDLTRTREYATDMLNAAYRKTGAINKRKGFKHTLTNADAFYGMANFSQVNPVDGQITEELLVVNKKLHKIKDYPFNISYEGDSDVYVSLFSTGTVFKFQVKVQDNLLIDQELGTGLSSVYSISDLKTTLDALRFKVASIPNNTSVVDTGTTTSLGKVFNINIPVTNVNNSLLIKLNSELKVNNEVTKLTITSVTVNEDANEEISSYDLVVEGQSHELSNLTSSGAGVQIDLNEFNNLTISVDNAALALQAALMEMIVDTRVENSATGGTDLFIKDLETLTHGNSNVSAGSSDYLNWQVGTDNVLDNDDLENASFAQINNVMYVSNGYDDLLKYDGRYVYSAGLPNADKSILSFTNVSGSIHSGATRKVEYILVYEYTDFKGNVISSQPSLPEVHDLPTSKNVQIGITIGNTFANRDDTGGFTTGHPLHDTLSVAPGSTKTMTEALSKYKDEKCMRIKVYRSKVFDPSSPALEVVGQHYLVADLPMDATTFTDENTDDQLNTFLALVDPIKRHDPPPKGKYLAVFKNCLASSGDIADVNNVRYSLPRNASTGEIGSEYFPDDENGIIVDSPFGNKITAIAPLRDLLYVFHTNSISVVGGQINLLEQPVSELLTREGNYGCISFHSIQEVQNTLFFLSDKGIYSIDSSNAVKETSSLINTLFSDVFLQKKRSVAVNWASQSLMILQIPKEVVFSNSRRTEAGSLVIVYDYYRGAWLKWDNIDMAAGASIYKNNLNFLSRPTTDATLNAMNQTNTKFDYTDHTEVVDFKYETNWESLGEPTVPKKFLRLKNYAFDTDGTFESPGFNLKVGVQKNYISSNLGEINFDFDSLSTAGWGIPPWGEFAWGSAAAPFLKSKLISGKTKSLKLVFSNNTINENVLITTYEMEIAAPYGMEIKD